MGGSRTDMKVYVCETGDQELTDICKLYKDRKKAVEWKKLTRRVLRMMAKEYELSRHTWEIKDGKIIQDKEMDDKIVLFLNELSPVCKKLGFNIFAQTWADFHRMDIE